MAPVTASSPDSDLSPPPQDLSDNQDPSAPPPSSSPPPDSSSKTPPPSSPPPLSPPPPSSSPPPPSSWPPPASPPSKSSPPPTASPSPPPPVVKSSAPKGSPPSPPPPDDDSPATSPPPTVTATPPPPGGASPPPPITNSPPSSALPSPPIVASPPPPGGLTPPSSFVSPPPPREASPKMSPSPNKSPSSTKSPSTASSSSSSSSSPSSPSSSAFSNNTAIIEATIGGILIFAIIIISLTLCLRKKKKSYYMDTPPGLKAGELYNGLTSWNRPQPGEHNVKLPPPPGLMGTPPGGVVGWAAPGVAPPPPPPAAMASSEYSSGFSGTNHSPMQTPSPNMGLGNSQSSFTYNELATATNGFSHANLLGQGGFGFVHKGVLPNGKEVAVKSLKSGSGQGEREFQAEVEIISRVHHRHLVSLVGYCIADGQRMLVYEFVPNKTLEFHLHGKGQPPMDWATRMRIALGSAKGLAYLHEDCHPKIIHRDIKAANILLDYNFEAMVADFGLAKLSSDNYTHVSTRVMGTFGYLAPEYASSGKLTEKSDVFSFGVMLLELITGRRPVDLTNRVMEDSLVDWARPLLARAAEDGNYEELVDPRLENNFVSHEMARIVSCAAASIRHSARRRPKMSQIVRALEGDSSLDDLNEGVKPGQSSAFNKAGNSSIVGYDTGAYNADMTKFRKMVLSNQEFTSSTEYEATSEYGLNPSSSSGDSHEMGHSVADRHKI